jgi:hypothetical protein
MSVGLRLPLYASLSRSNYYYYLARVVKVFITTHFVFLVGEKLGRIVGEAQSGDLIRVIRVIRGPYSGY